MARLVHVPQKFEWRKQLLSHRWKLVGEDGKTVATVWLRWINAIKGGGIYGGKRFEIIERFKPERGVFIKREDDLDYWGKFEPGYGGGYTMFVLRNLQRYRIIDSGHGNFDLCNRRGEIIATTRFSITSLGNSYFTHLRLDPEDPEPSLLAIVSLITAYQWTVSKLASQV